jgi:PAS domain S-box-containing protein
MQKRHRTSSDLKGEIAALVRTLQDTRQRLEELTGGKMDAALMPAADSISLKDVQERLRQSEERFQNMFAAAATGIAVSTPKGRFLYANAAYCTMLGYTEAELQELNFAALTHPEDLSLNLELRDELLAGKRKSFIMEKRYLKKSGEVVWTRQSVSATHSEGGEIATLLVVAEDITERKNAEEELQRQKAELQALFDLMPAMVWLKDTANGVLRVNQRAARATGKSVEEIEGRSMLELYPHEAAKYYADDLDVIQSRAPKLGIVEKLRAAGDREIWVQTDKVPVCDQTGKVVGIVVMVQDITESKLAEESLALFRSLIDRSPDAIEVIDPKTGNFLDVNATGCARLGYSREEMLALNLADIDIEKDYRTLWPVIVEEVKKAGFITTIGRHRKKDGSTFPVEVNARFINLNRGYMVAVVRDITERVLAEQRLHEHAALLEIARDAIMVLNLDGSICYWNCGAESVYGWTKSEAMGRNVADLLGTNPEKYQAAHATMLDIGEWSGELHQKSKSGAPVIVASRWTLLRDAHGNPKSMLAINSDITEHKNLQEQFLRAQRLESIGTLASGVAHDLNNILAPILMSAAILREETSKELREKIVSSIETSAQRGADIVRQVLTFARGAEGRRLIVQPAHLIKEMARIAEETFPKSIRIHAKYPPSLWSIEADSTQMHQVLLNLCVNARDAMPEGGDLVLSVENLLIDEHFSTMLPGTKPGAYVLLQISDSGTGIPREIIDQIFDPFFTTKTVEKGTGLGLSTTIGIVRSHGGVINVASEVGAGTTFKVYLPAIKDAPVGVAEESEAEHSLRGHEELLLVVDDERSIRETAQVILQRHGYRVLIAADGTEAIKAFARHEHEIRAVLTDVMMPNLDGVTLIRALRTMKPDVVIIVSTGRSDEARMKELNALNAPHCLIKPYTKQNLLTTVRDALAHAKQE